MSQVVGIPRALLYYELYPMWKAFFDSLGVKTVLSPPTNKRILEDGVRNTVDEVCLPVKLAVGHVFELKEKTDYIFLPKVISIVPGEYNCPKILGLPDFARYYLTDGHQLIDTSINLHETRRDLWKFFSEVGSRLGFKQLKTRLAYEKARRAQKEYNKLLLQNNYPEEAMDILQGRMVERRKETAGDINIAVVGHSYVLYDEYINLSVFEKLKKQGVNIYTPQVLADKVMRSETASLYKRLYWSLAQQVLGAAYYYMQAPFISGVIHITPFGCGVDSMIGELMDKYVGEVKKPFMRLVLDEHTGEAGFVTRIEAFLDMLKRRKLP
ncbi:MAG: acyl-CoA dehydratase activase-related protein [Clostridiales bacterium]|nr:acyl-CoA dehydratase activase-related protein [Clostridiales bacterium]MCF8023321.1 acyl-CoA dehydratase activase-related protein [Clostridiales bacterium]